MNPIPHYIPRVSPDGKDFGFTTPTGDCYGFMTMASVARIAAATEREDRQQSSRSGPIAKILRDYFTEERAAE